MATRGNREQDLKELCEMLEREPNPETRANIREAIRLVKNESGLVSSMREALIKAHRSGNRAEIMDIHDFIRGKEKYGQHGTIQ